MPISIIQNGTSTNTTLSNLNLTNNFINLTNASTNIIPNRSASSSNISITKINLPKPSYLINLPKPLETAFLNYNVRSNKDIPVNPSSVHSSININNKRIRSESTHHNIPTKHTEEDEIHRERKRQDKILSRSLRSPQQILIDNQKSKETMFNFRKNLTPEQKTENNKVAREKMSNLRQSRTPDQAVNCKPIQRMRNETSRQIIQQNFLKERSKYLTDFNIYKNGSLHLQEWVQQEIKNYNEKIDKINMLHCKICHQRWFSVTQIAEQDTCLDCIRDKVSPKLFSSENDTIPFIDKVFDPINPYISKQLEDLTMVEEILISPILAIMSVFRLSGGQLACRGYVANFSQDISSFCQSLPRLTNSLPIIIVRKRGQNNESRDFKVNKARVESVLRYLCRFNASYIKYGIKISLENLDKLPADAIPDNMNIIEEESNIDSSDNHVGVELSDNDFPKDDYQAFVDAPLEQYFEIDKIKQVFDWPSANKTPINEFEFDGIASLLFPKLFPKGLGDPTKKARLRYVTETQGFQHLLKYCCKNSKGVFYYPFASHPRFKFWAYDRLRRHRGLDQTKIYLKQNLNDANLTISELKDKLKNNSGEEILQRMSAYSANITGSDPYWYKRRVELEATFEQKKTATIFFTFSYADNHWQDFHKLMPDSGNLNGTTRYTNVLQNPHIVDSYFGIRINKFLESFFDNILDCEWRWHRYEWQSRLAIHGHGAARLRNDPGLTQLTIDVYAGRNSQKLFPLPENQFQNIEKYLQIINKGFESEEKIILYTDTLITAMNENNQRLNEVPEPHPCSYRCNSDKTEDIDKDYFDLINCCQRHVCRLEGYCKSNKDSKKGKCRFGYPFQKIGQTKIVFTEHEESNYVKAEIFLKRNDESMNMHNRVIAHNWRGNVDMQVIIDKRAAILYMVKYAAKGEKASKSLQSIFKSVVSFAKNDDDPISKLRSLMLRSLGGHRDIGQSEVCRLLLSEPLYHSSFKYVYQSLELNSRQVNTKANNDENAFSKSTIDIFANRYNEKQLENHLDKAFNLVEFIKNFQIKREKIELNPKPDQIVVITRPTIKFIPENKAKHTEYCYYQLIKYSDWHIGNKEQILNKDNAIENWKLFMETAPLFVKTSVSFTIDVAKELERIRTDPLTQEETSNQFHQSEWMELAEIMPEINQNLIENEIQIDRNFDWFSLRNEFSQSQLDSMDNWIEMQKYLNNFHDLNLDIVLPEQLNLEQRFAFDLIKQFNEKKQQLLMIIIGTAGTGKSFTVSAISHYLKYSLRKAAPTAKAAFIINGDTIHSLFHIPASNKKNHLDSLTDNNLRKLQEEFEETKFIIIDEFSMTGQEIFCKIDKRLKQAKNNSLAFGGVSIILTGDPGQLLPVLASPLYDKNCKSEFSIAGFEAYKMFEVVVELKQTVRQQNLNNCPKQQHFMELLPRLRNGESTIDDWKLLLERAPTPENTKFFENAVRLFDLNESVDNFNKEKLQNLGKPITKLTSINSNSRALSANSDIFSGLKNCVYLSVESQIVLTSNIWKKFGLVNGSTGIIKSFIYDPNKPVSNLPRAIILHFKDYTGPQFFDDILRKNWIPINPLSIYSSYVAASRTQFPLRLSYALTITRSQGQTLSQAVIDLGKTERKLGLSFVALSRIKNINDMLITPFPFERLSKIKESKNLKPRLEEEARLNNLITQTRLKFNL